MTIEEILARKESQTFDCKSIQRPQSVSDTHCGNG